MVFRKARYLDSACKAGKSLAQDVSLTAMIDVPTTPMRGHGLTVDAVILVVSLGIMYVP